MFPGNNSPFPPGQLLSCVDCYCRSHYSPPRRSLFVTKYLSRPHRFHSKGTRPGRATRSSSLLAATETEMTQKLATARVSRAIDFLAGWSAHSEHPLLTCTLECRTPKMRRGFQANHNTEQHPVDPITTMCIGVPF